MDQKKIPEFGTILADVTYVERPGAYGLLFNDLGQLAIIHTSFGQFLPGGGLDPGETELEGLRRELKEEIGFTLTRANFLMKVAQYHWSEFYQKHFKKIGAFYHIEAMAPTTPEFQDGHTLLWKDPAEGAQILNQEFQRYAVLETLRDLLAKSYT